MLKVARALLYRIGETRVKVKQCCLHITNILSPSRHRTSFITQTSSAVFPGIHIVRHRLLDTVRFIYYSCCQLSPGIILQILVQFDCSGEKSRQLTLLHIKVSQDKFTIIWTHSQLLTFTITVQTFGQSHIFVAWSKLNTIINTRKL